MRTLSRDFTQVTSEMSNKYKRQIRRSYTHFQEKNLSVFKSKTERKKKKEVYKMKVLFTWHYKILYNALGTGFFCIGLPPRNVECRKLSLKAKIKIAFHSTLHINCFNKTGCVIHNNRNKQCLIQYALKI